MLLSSDVSPGREFWYQLFLVGLAATVSPFLGGGWLTDDFAHVHRLLMLPTVSEIFRSPDPFGFYRPLADATLLADSLISGFKPVMWRVSNLMIHLLVVLLAYRLSRRLVTQRAAFLGVLAFVLTPKAHTIAIFWASARPELLMSLFSLVALICWIEWDRHDRLPWLAAAGAAYTLAFLSKETAVLLPLLMLAMPSSGTVPTSRRLLGMGSVLALAVIPIGLRISAGALMPVSTDSHYAWVWSIHRWFRGVEVYLPRVLPSPVALALFVALPAAVGVWRHGARLDIWNVLTLRWLTLALVWFLVFIAPVLLIVARSELYLYLPGLGFCLFAGHVIDRVLATNDRPHFAAVGLATVILGLVGYQVVRAVQSQRVLQFTDALVRTMEQDPWLHGYRGDLIVVPADPKTDKLFRDGVGGHINLVLENTLGRTGSYAVVAYADQTTQGHEPRVICTYDGDRVRFTQEAGQPNSP
jgi:hypothetical protein